MTLELWQIVAIAAIFIAAVWVLARVSTHAYFKSKREHTKALLRDMDVEDDAANPNSRKDQHAR